MNCPNIFSKGLILFSWKVTCTTFWEIRLVAKPSLIYLVECTYVAPSCTAWNINAILTEYEIVECVILCM